jgi:hypothetical protein
MTTTNTLCLFCPAELDETTKPEHILLNALGGRKTTTGAICSACNNKFGRTIDDVLTSQITALRNLLQLESGTGNSALHRQRDCKPKASYKYRFVPSSMAIGAQGSNAATIPFCACSVWTIRNAASKNLVSFRSRRHAGR